MTYSFLFDFTKSVKSMTFESTFFKGCVFVKVVKSSLGMVLLLESCISQRCYFKNNSLLESRELSFQIMVSGTPVSQGSYVCLTLHLYSIDGSHAGLRKIRWDFVFIPFGKWQRPSKPT